ncbi:hypothetical protein PTRG_12118 [Pyrenophora tritici-repentis Pt-1C-BFP]|uniref:DUF676 domain-containing protein n=1 Tax=Pyrenophora tritici-repentis (strain Pt-1C-BFP) TaxID=426418 RepID=B2WQ58_PYRTR|nr:uncharacterized protein PTRG_12118 [Pyrenophora tritici-repentis Pt-1C-BFP]EDU47311.1 hypothetical protein PTRG_12118 [Pyrenophora tritici-repentis Pt-1C-BFP]
MAALAYRGQLDELSRTARQQTQVAVRPVTNDDIGLKILREAPVEAEQSIDIVAVHGLGAHPDDSWCTNAGTKESLQWVNWLEEESMLPAVAPNARIMRYGYQSQWFGKEMMQQSVSTVAERLLRALKRTRKDVPFRPLMFVAHCFGGLVVLKTLLEAEQYQKDWPGVFLSTTGLIFFGTPFRGAEGMNQMEMLEAARREYHEDQRGGRQLLEEDAGPNKQDTDCMLL